MKFTEQGSVVVCGEVTRTDGERLWVRFEVRDTDIGLSLEQQARLSQVFGQADVPTTRSYGGTKLGLAISSRLTELMGGVSAWRVNPATIWISRRRTWRMVGESLATLQTRRRPTQSRVNCQATRPLRAPRCKAQRNASSRVTASMPFGQPN